MLNLVVHKVTTRLY